MIRKIRRYENMKITVLNGSPKGDKSVTLQYVRFIMMTEPKHSFTIHHIAKNIQEIERDPHKWDEISSSIHEADLILWATPVYYLHVPAQLKRFIELVSERNTAGLFAGKYAASLTTSIHFFDQYPHQYLQEISEDLHMKWSGSFSAHMQDLLDIRGQKQILAFGKEIISSCQEQRPVQRNTLPLEDRSSPYKPGETGKPVNTAGRKVVVLHDARPGSNLELMVRQITSSFGGEATVVHLDDIGMKGGCLGCIQCAFDNTCIYKDGYRSFWDNTIQPADILVYAGEIKDRFLSSEWKQFFDRSFFLGHIPKVKGKQLIFLVRGPLLQMPRLRDNLAEITRGAILIDMISDDSGDSASLDSLIHFAAEKAGKNCMTGYCPPAMFPTVAGHKLLRMRYGEE